jgi:hypothetical protein
MHMRRLGREHVLETCKDGTRSLTVMDPLLG